MFQTQFSILYVSHYYRFTILNEEIIYFDKDHQKFLVKYKIYYISKSDLWGFSHLQRPTSTVKFNNLEYKSAKI